MMSAPISRATSTGRLRTRPPSPRSRPRTCAGANAPGIDIEARIATDRGTSSSTTCRPVSRSVATARKRIGRSFRLAASLAWLEMPRRNSSRFCEPNAPRGSTMPCFFSPSSPLPMKRRSSSLRRNERSSRGGRSEKISAQSALRMISSICAGVSPEAYAPPTIEPMLVATMKSTGTRCSRRTLSTPMCARPRAPPPERTRPILGRGGSAGCACRCSAAAHASAAASFTRSPTPGGRCSAACGGPSCLCARPRE